MSQKAKKKVRFEVKENETISMKELRKNLSYKVSGYPLLTSDYLNLSL